jgi:hypothetical protein
MCPLTMVEPNSSASESSMIPRICSPRVEEEPQRGLFHLLSIWDVCNHQSHESRSTAAVSAQMVLTSGYADNQQTRQGSTPVSRKDQLKVAAPASFAA